MLGQINNFSFGDEKNGKISKMVNWTHSFFI